jgi:YaiO family outer membrane protein
MTVAAFACACALALAGSVAPAWAAPTTEVELSQNAIYFTSPGNTYGPWHLTSLTLESNVDGSTYGGEVDYGTTEQLSSNISRGTFVSLNNTQNWTDTFYTFAAIGAGTANPYPTLSAYVEANFKTLASRRLVLSVGLGTDHYASGFSGQLLSIGGEYYWPKFVAGVRALIEQNTSSPTVLGALTTVEFDPAPGRSIVGTLQIGEQNYLSAAPSLPPSRANYQGYAAALTFKQNIGRSVGVALGGVLQQQHDAVSGQPVFTSRGFTLGFYFEQ